MASARDRLNSYVTHESDEDQDRFETLIDAVVTEESSPTAAGRPTYYLADHAKSGRALFSVPTDAREWLEYQTDYHHAGQEVRWIDGGDHGWEALRLADGATAGSVYQLKLDGTLPDYDANDRD
ncbi:hypothetical protein [Streptomyces decoyicus]|uniref:hypothetical protein n=1 Tax=Streptomyces decoyicus TaxID=249567 RepID=UPI002F907C38